MLFLVFALAVGCAVQQKPQGGPKDTTPPKLLIATPANLTKNFTAKEVKLDFDEFFKLTNQFQEITVFPAPEKNPDYKVRGKSLIIELKDTLQKNTTYVVNFGKAIADVNEGNVMKNFTYVFSTGDHIDSLSISGTVTNNTTQLKEKDATVMLFTLHQDSLLFGKKKPSLFTTTDSSGNFRLSNLKEGVYRLYALKEAANDKIYNNDAELIGFVSKPINLTKDTDNIAIKIFKQSPTVFRLVDRKFSNEGALFFTFNKPLVKPSVKILYPEALDQQKLTDVAISRDSVTVYSKNMDFDSIQVAIYENGKPIDTTALRKGRKETFSRNLAFKFGVSSMNELKPGTDLKLYSNLPVESFEQSLITLKEDSANVNFNLSIDTGTANKRLTLKYKWKPKSSYLLTLNPDAFTSIYGDRNKKQGRTLALAKPESFGNLTLKMAVPDSTKSYVVEFLNEAKEPLRRDVITKNTTLNYKDFYVGKFAVRVVYDANRNGKWDSGNVAQKTQPENMWVYEKIFTLRPNWDTEEMVQIPKEVITP